MSVPDYNGQGVRGTKLQGDFVPLKLTAFSYFRDYFLNKIITEIWKFRTTKLFPFAGGGPKSMAKLDGGPWPDWPRGSVPAGVHSAYFKHSANPVNQLQQAVVRLRLKFANRSMAISI